MPVCQQPYVEYDDMNSGIPLYARWKLQGKTG